MSIRSILLIFCLLPVAASAQTTFSTVPPLNGGNSANGISFQLTSNTDLTVLSFSSAFDTDIPNQVVEVWYSSSDLTGQPNITTANDWTQIGSTTLTGLSPLFSAVTLQEIPIDVNLFMAAGTTYRYYIGNSNALASNVIYSNGSGSYTDGSVTITTGGSVGFGGPIPGPPFNPRQFNGAVTYTLGRLTPEIPEPYISTNSGAINSLLTTGFLMGSANRAATQNAGSAPSGVLRQRLFQARSTQPTGEGFEVNASRKVSSTSRYLDFAARLNIDYRVALGLVEGREVQIGDSVSSASERKEGNVKIEAKAVVPDPAGAKQTIGGKVAIEERRPSRFSAYTQFDFGFYDQDNLNTTIRGFETDSYAGSVGLEYAVNDWLVVGGAFSYLESDTNISDNLGGVDVEGMFLSAYATAFFGDAWMDVSYSYGDLENDLFRNTLLGTTAIGETDSYSENVDVNFGQNFALNEQVSFGPTLGLGYSTGQIDGYTERGAGAANVVFPDDDFESLISRLGGQVTYRKETEAGDLTVQGRAAWAHEFMPEGDQIAASLQTSPFSLITPTSATTATSQSIGGFSATSASPHVGQDWLELGVTARMDFDNRWHAQAGYDGVFGRNNASAHFGSVKIGYEW